MKMFVWKNGQLINAAPKSQIGCKKQIIIILFLGGYYGKSKTHSLQ